LLARGRKALGGTFGKQLVEHIRWHVIGKEPAQSARGVPLAAKPPAKTCESGKHDPDRWSGNQLQLLRIGEFERNPDKDAAADEAQQRQAQVASITTTDDQQRDANKAEQLDQRPGSDTKPA